MPSEFGRVAGARSVLQFSLPSPPIPHEQLLCCSPACHANAHHGLASVRHLWLRVFCARSCVPVLLHVALTSLQVSTLHDHAEIVGGLPPRLAAASWRLGPKAEQGGRLPLASGAAGQAGQCGTSRLACQQPAARRSGANEGGVWPEADCTLLTHHIV